MVIIIILLLTRPLLLRHGSYCPWDSGVPGSGVGVREGDKAFGFLVAPTTNSSACTRLMYSTSTKFCLKERTLLLKEVKTEKHYGIQNLWEDETEEENRCSHCINSGSCYAHSSPGLGTYHRLSAWNFHRPTCF